MATLFEGMVRRGKVDGELTVMNSGGGTMAGGGSSWERGREEENLGESKAWVRPRMWAPFIGPRR
jgi:hypothetical protein